MEQTTEWVRNSKQIRAARIAYLEKSVQFFQRSENQRWLNEKRRSREYAAKLENKVLTPPSLQNIISRSLGQSAAQTHSQRQAMERSFELWLSSPSLPITANGI